MNIVSFNVFVSDKKKAVILASGRKSVYYYLLKSFVIIENLYILVGVTTTRYFIVL